jgi:succinylarginine dihydrolase
MREKEIMSSKLQCQILNRWNRFFSPALTNKKIEDFQLVQEFIKILQVLVRLLKCLFFRLSKIFHAKKCIHPF